MMGAAESKYRHPSSSVIVAPAEDDKHSPVYRNINFKDGLIPTAFPEVRTIYDAFQRGLKVNPNGKCMGSRLDTGKTKQEIDERKREKVRTSPLPLSTLPSCVFFFSPHSRHVTYPPTHAGGKNFWRLRLENLHRGWGTSRCRRLGAFEEGHGSPQR